MLLFQKANYSDALKMCEKAARQLGADNPRIQYFKARVLFEHHSDSSSTIIEAVQILEETAVKAPFITDAAILLVQLYEKLLHFDKAIKFLQKYREVRN